MKLQHKTQRKRNKNPTQKHCTAYCIKNAAVALVVRETGRWPLVQCATSMPSDGANASRPKAPCPPTARCSFTGANASAGALWLTMVVLKVSNLLRNNRSRSQKPAAEARRPGWEMSSFTFPLFSIEIVLNQIFGLSNKYSKGTQKIHIIRLEQTSSRWWSRECIPS